MADNNISISSLQYYKGLYSGHKIIYVRFSNTEFVFRTLNRREYKYIMAAGMPPMDIEDAICNTCCLYPEDYDFETCGFAGLNEYISEVIKEISGFTDIETVLSEYRQAKNFTNLEIQLMDLIKAFIPEYTYEEMEEWTWEKLVQKAARAEEISKLKGFDWHIVDNAEEYKEDFKSINSDNQDFIKELDKNGIDPMFYFAEEIRHSFKREVLDFPLIGGSHWNDEVILGVIRKQIRKADAWRQHAR